MKKLSAYRMFSLLLTLLLVMGFVPTQTRATTFDTENFKGLVIEAESDVSISVYYDHGNTDAKKLTPDHIETADGLTHYYFANLSGACRCDAKRSGDYTIYKLMYMTATEAATKTVEKIVMNKRAGQWDHSYYYEHPSEFMYAMEYDPDQKWKELVLDTPVFTIERAAQQMTTQPELEAYIQKLDDDNDDMYIFSIGTSSKYNFNIPIVFFTKTDLSDCTTLKQVADKLKADGRPNVAYKAQTHGDEPASGEGALNVIRMLDQQENQYLLENINIYVIPRINPDGAYLGRRNLSVMIDPSLENTDPDRDLMDMNSKEMRQYMYAPDLLQPIVELDGHEKGHGSDRGEIQFGVAWKPINSKALLDVQVDMMMNACEDLKEMDLSGAWYDSCVNAASSRNNRGFATYQGRIQILMESRGIYMGTEAYGSRTASHVISAMSYLKYTAENADTLAALVAAERERIITEGAVYDEDDIIILSSGKTTHPEYTVKTEDYNTLSGSIKWVDMVPDLYDQILRGRVAPTAYVLPADLPKIDKILEQMDAQSIAYTKLPNHAAVSLQQYYGSTEEAFLTQERTVVFPKGAYVFTMDQPKGEILALLMEPDVTDLAQYKNNLTFQGRIPQDEFGYFSTYRYIHDLQNGKIAYTIGTSAPAGLTAEKAPDGKFSGAIGGLQADRLYEYRKAGADTYTAIPAGTTKLENLNPGTYYIRYRDTVSADAVVSIGTTMTVYVSAAGSDTNIGTAENAPFATLEKAYGALNQSLASAGEAAGGVIVLLDDYTITAADRVDMPSHTFPVEIRGKISTVKLIFKPTTIGEKYQQLAFHGPTTLDNLEFRGESTSKLDYIFACGYPFTVGSGVTTSCVSSLPNISGGDYKTPVENTNLTLLGGKWYAAYAGSFQADTTGTAKIVIDGATVSQSVRIRYSGTTTGDAVMDLKNIKVNNVYPAYSGNVSGDVTINLRENVTANVYTGNYASGNVTGTVEVLLAGADTTKAQIRNTPLASNTTGTVTKGVLVYAKGNAVPVAGFDEVHIRTDSTVILTSDLTVDKISGGGTVELNGYKLTGTGAVNAKIKTVTLRPGAAGLYFTGDFDVTAGASYGIALSTENEKPEAKDNTGSLYTAAYNSVLVKDILKAGNTDNGVNANGVIYARAYVKLLDGTIVYGQVKTVTFRQLVMAVDGKWNSLTTVQQEALKAMYNTFKAEMASWQIPNIKATA